MRFESSVDEVAQHFADYIDRVARKGERFILMRGEEPVAELLPVGASRRMAELPGILASLPRLGADDAVVLADEIEQAATELSQRPANDPWNP